jgi:HTH-type transcriptional regulator/antitoxin HigA
MATTSAHGIEGTAFLPGYAVHPGETIAEWLEESGMTQAELANRIGMSAKALNQMVRGHAPVTPETSLRLEAVTGIPARTWNALQALFAEDTARLQRHAELAAQVDFLDQIPVTELRRRGHVTAPRQDKVTVLREVCDFFGVSDPRAWQMHWAAPAAAYRRSAAFEAHPGAVATWLRLGEIEAKSVAVGPYDKELLTSALPRLRALTLEPDPGVFVGAITSLCGKAGLTVVFIPEVPGARCSGAARWVSGRPVVQLSLRHKTDDHLWFTLFHEIGHVLLHGRSEVFIDDGADRSPERRVMEDQADEFAQDVLIPGSAAAGLPELKTLESIATFAEQIGVSPGVVVGRLQHDQMIGYRIGNRLKRRYEFSSAI